MQAEAQAILDEQVDALTSGRDCWAPEARPQVIPATVVVRGARTNKTVAWEMSLDDAFVANGAGDEWQSVIVVRACAAG